MWATAITVCPNGCDYSNVQAAINAASPGDSIEVGSGVYYENIEVNKSINLLGRDTGAGMPKIDADGVGSVIALYANGVTLQGFNVTGSGHCGCGNAGIKVLSNNNTIAGNTIYGNKYGIYDSGYRGNLFYRNDLVGNNITVYDTGKDQWDENHYSDYDNSSTGCMDANGDGICDSPRNITPGSGTYESDIDLHPLTIWKAP